MQQAGQGTTSTRLPSALAGWRGSGLEGNIQCRVFGLVLADPGVLEGSCGAWPMVGVRDEQPVKEVLGKGV